MIPFYSTLCNTLITSRSQQLTHPVTGEIYGSGNYDNAIKLEQLGAISVVYNDGNVPENPVQIGTSISVENDVATVTKTWRSKTQQELYEESRQQILNDISQTEVTNTSIRKIEDLYEILLTKELISESDIPENVLSWINTRKEDRSEFTLLDQISGA